MCSNTELATGRSEFFFNTFRLKKRPEENHLRHPPDSRTNEGLVVGGMNDEWHCLCPRCCPKPLTMASLTSWVVLRYSRAIPDCPELLVAWLQHCSYSHHVPRGGVWRALRRQRSPRSVEFSPGAASTRDSSCPHGQGLTETQRCQPHPPVIYFMPEVELGGFGHGVGSGGSEPDILSQSVGPHHPVSGNPPQFLANLRFTCLVTPQDVGSFCTGFFLKTKSV